MAIPTLLSTHGMLDPWALSHKFFKKKLAWYFYQKNDVAKINLIHTTSPVESKNISDLGVEVPRIMIPNAVSYPLDVNTRRNNKKVALFLSRIHPVKGVLDLIEAWNSINNTGWSLIIAGNGEKQYTKLIIDKVNNYKLHSKIKFTGYVTGKQKESLYRKSDLFILPTYSENFGLAIAEAMSYGIPVITTKAAPWSIIVKNNCGWWIDIGLDSLSKAITHALNTPLKELQEKGINARRVISKYYTWSIVAPKIADTYKQLVLKN